MAVNNVAKVARLYGLQIGDRFKLIDNKNKVLKQIFVFDENECIKKIAPSEADDPNWNDNFTALRFMDILVGKYSVIKIK